MINKTKAYKNITLLGLVSCNICISKNIRHMLAEGKVTDSGFKSSLQQIVV
jgi:hypothetical protein